MDSAKEKELAERIAGEIVFSEHPGHTIKKWREIFTLTQSDIARKMGINPSVISDYESSRRRSPGIQTIKRIIDAMIELDRENGSRTIGKYMLMGNRDAIIDIREFDGGVPIDRFVRAIDGEYLSRVEYTEHRIRDIHGYTFMDSIKTIMELDATDYLNVYGWSTERALIFTKVYYGRSPMIAVRVHPFKPAAVVYHKPEQMDELAIKLAEKERIPLIVTNLEVEELLERLAKI